MNFENKRFNAKRLAGTPLPIYLVADVLTTFKSELPLIENAEKKVATSWEMAIDMWSNKETSATAEAVSEANARAAAEWEKIQARKAISR